MALVEIAGRSKTIAEWAREPGAVSAALIRRRLELGWAPERAVFEPTRPAKLDTNAATEIRRRVEAGENTKDVARELGVSRNHVGAIVRGLSHKQGEAQVSNERHR